ncbi:MAG: protein phosphatase 2C domain-containing protein [Pseudomonadota bacterium]
MGLVREINEDAYLDQAERGIWAVADGMGGHAVGDVASNMVIEALRKTQPSTKLAQFIANAQQQLQIVNQQLRVEAALRQAQIIGSTVVALLAYDCYCGYLWAGDSRIYLSRNGRLTRLTRDHSRVEELKSRRHLSAASAMPQAAHNVITRAVGASDILEVDEGTMEVNDGDIFLLCSDGLSNALSEQEIGSTLFPGNYQLACEALVDMALKRGGRDNISAVVVGVEDLYSAEKTVMNPAL